MNEFLYKKARWLYNILVPIRMNYYIYTNQHEKGKEIIHEGFKWRDNE